MLTRASTFTNPKLLETMKGKKILFEFSHSKNITNFDAFHQANFFFTKSVWMNDDEEFQFEHNTTHKNFSSNNILMMISDSDLVLLNPK